MRVKEMISANIVGPFVCFYDVKIAQLICLSTNVLQKGGFIGKKARFLVMDWRDCAGELPRRKLLFSLGFLGLLVLLVINSKIISFYIIIQI